MPFCLGVKCQSSRHAAASTSLAIIFERIASGLDCLVFSRGMNRVTLSYCYSGEYLPRVSALNCIAKPKFPAVWACLGVDPLDIPEPRAREGKRAQKPTMPYHPHPHIIICTSFISSIDYNVFIVLQCHLNDHLYRKVT